MLFDLVFQLEVALQFILCFVAKYFIEVFVGFFGFVAGAWDVVLSVVTRQHPFRVSLQAHTGLRSRAERREQESRESKSIVGSRRAL